LIYGCFVSPYTGAFLRGLRFSNRQPGRKKEILETGPDISLYSLLYRPAVSFHTATLIFLIFIFIEHWLQDYLKHRINNGGRQAYYIDQVAHVTLLYLYRIFIFPG